MAGPRHRADSAAIEDIPSSMNPRKPTMNETTQVTCNCAACPGAGCLCGCQQYVAQSAQTACACGPQCQCGPACACAKS
jgi:hypothetical protein